MECLNQWNHSVIAIETDPHPPPSSSHASGFCVEGFGLLLFIVVCDGG
ncbi:hypothetical protein Tco_1224851, partial [Tanacetum coccineum]